MLNKQLSLRGLVGLVIVLAGVAIGTHPPGDNSFFTHLATGRVIWDTHHIPAHDIYTFTSAGRSWVVQSWLASVIYVIGDHIAGLRGVMVEVGASAGLLALLVWRLTSPARTLLTRLLIAALVVGVGAGFWVERPLLFGLLCLAGVLFAAEGRLDPRWLVPIMWIWVNVHGSFPLGLVAIAALYVGRRLDNEDASSELGALKWAAIGTAIGAVNPIGPRLLVFPLELLSKQDILRQIVEWQAPRFTSLDERIFLGEILLAIVLLVRRPRWRSALALVIFVGASLLGARNVVIASIVLVPGLARGLADLGSLDGSERRFIFRPMAMVLCAGAALVVISQLHDPLTKIEHRYPVQAVSAAEALGVVAPDKRLITQDFVGNYLELRYGTAANVFIDDRYDMELPSTVDDYSTLLGGQPGWDTVLDRLHADAVLWRSDQPLASLLELSPAWRIAYIDASWVVAIRS